MFKIDDDSRRFYGITEIGCFNDNETDRDLSFYKETNELKITNNLCGDICYQNKFNFAGTQNGWIFNFKKSNLI